MHPAKLKIFNGKIITPGGIIRNGTLIISGDAIELVTGAPVEIPGAVEIDAGGKYISPGFIDMHVHGGAGHDFMDGNRNAFLEVARMHARHGTTAMTPTTLTCEKRDILQSLHLYEEASKENLWGSQFIGMHLEGPYLAMSQRGAQDARYIRDPDPKEYREILERQNPVKRWSAAPELRGALEFGDYIQSKGVMPAIAHTDAIYEEVSEAFKRGYRHATHFYSAMSGVTRRNGYRYAGVIESAYLIDDMTVEIIADGVHLPAPLLKLVYKLKGAEKTALVTDAMRAAGMPPGESILGSLKSGIKVVVEDNVAKLPDRSSFAGSVATADRLVRNMINLAEVPLVDAVRMMTATPASIMGLSETKGSLKTGMDADIVIFDEDIRIDKTIIKGRVVYAR